MQNNLKRIFLLLSTLILVLFIIFVINQTVQVIAISTQINPLLGKAAFWGLLFLYTILIVYPVYLFFRLPRALQPPANQNSAEFDVYLQRLSRRLRKNPLLREYPVNTLQEVETALAVLDEHANLIVKRHATTVFLTTAISQSGRLDAFTVLITQFRMVWQVAKLYYQRPSLREITHLYANVAATSFVAGELNDIHINEQIEPIIASVLGATLTGAIPGVSTVAGIITGSLLTGSANAYLTLRVGAITRQYTGALVKKDRRMIRRSATLEAARMLSIIVMNSAGNISRAIVSAAMKSPGKFSRHIMQNTWNRFSGKNKTEPGIS
ncbi:MAG: DUF697 domain-containing protein [Calditrichia bacterium]